MPTPARLLAFRILAENEEGGALLAERMAARDVEALDRRERAFLHELVLGTLRSRGRLDHALARASARPLADLDGPTRNALRLGAYQVLRLRVPDRAAVSESVDLVRAASPKAAGFVNAVLRRLAREGAPPEPDPVKAPLEWLTTIGSLPPWIAERWLERLGPETAIARARAFEDVPPTVVRLNPRTQDAGARAAAAGIILTPLRVPGAWSAVGDAPGALAASGALYVQDQGSQMIAHLAAGEGRVLDACAAPGGKATLLADLGGPGTRVVAADVSRPRVRTLATLARRWGATNVHVLAADALRPPFAPGGFDSVLLDAPCSGLGTLGRNPDIRWRARPQDLPRHAARQREMLEAVADLVTPGGTLVYATCSLEPEENEGVVTPFLEARKEFGVRALPEWAGALASGAFARTLPERDGGDGFFAARLERRA
jgi:16S rRNA (cytosine967-C5)-methyltransferase